MVPLWVSRGGGGVLTVHVGGSGTSGLVRLYLLNFGFCIPRGGKINIIESSLAGSVSSLSALGEVPAVGGTPPSLGVSWEWLELDEGMMNDDVEDTAYCMEMERSWPSQTTMLVL